MDYYSEIKRELIDNEITQRVKYYSKNKRDLIARYNVGKLLFEAGKCYGENIIKSYSEKLKIDVNSKYNETTLKRMRQFYILIQKGAPLVHQLIWSNYVELIPIENIDAVKYYIQICVKELLSKRELRTRIKNNGIKKEHIGQIHVYMNYIDENLRKPFQDKTIGIIICKKNNEFLIKYCSDPRIIGKEYEIIN